jgi:hypothetical protein
LNTNDISAQFGTSFSGNRLSAATRLEEPSQLFACLFRQQSTIATWGVVQLARCKDVENTPRSASGWVRGSIDDSLNARVDDGARAHCARLEGDVKGGFGEPVIAHRRRCCPQRLYFRVRRGIATLDRAIPTTSNFKTVSNDERADGNFTIALGDVSER